MKRIKGIILIIMLLLLSGCDVKYNMKLENGMITEEIIVPYDSNYKEDYEKKYYYNISADGEYKTEIKDNSFILTTKKINLDSITSNDLYSFCYNNISVEEDELYYYIGTTSEFNCLTYSYLTVDNVEINIKTYNKVIKSNADSKKFGTYTWNVNKDNRKDKKITFVVSKNQYVWYYSYMGLIPTFLGIAALVFLVYIVYKYFKMRSKRVNKI